MLDGQLCHDPWGCPASLEQLVQVPVDGGPVTGNDQYWDDHILQVDVGGRGDCYLGLVTVPTSSLPRLLSPGLRPITHICGQPQSEVSMLLTSSLLSNSLHLIDTSL